MSIFGADGIQSLVLMEMDKVTCVRVQRSTKTSARMDQKIHLDALRVQRSTKTFARMDQKIHLHALRAQR